MKTLRARLLRLIVKDNFKEKFGEDWWSVLLDHMRELSRDKKDGTGSKYATALKKYGRGITLDDLDTTVLCSIILWDDYFNNGPNKVDYPEYELDTARKLHMYRNRMSHDERATENANTYAEKETIRVLRVAVDKMNLMERDPELAADILKKYTEFFGGENVTGDAEAFMELSRQFEEAESLYKWKIEDAIPLYESLAEKGFRAAKKKLLDIYSKTPAYFDLNKAVDILDRYPDIMDEMEKTQVRAFRDMMPHIIWGTPGYADRFAEELKSKDGVIRNARLEEYITWVTKEFPLGLLILIPAQEASDNRQCCRLMRMRTPDLKAAEENLHPTPCEADDLLIRTLIEIGSGYVFDPDVILQKLEVAADAGCLTVIEALAEMEAKVAFASGRPESTRWIEAGSERGLPRCVDLENTMSKLREKAERKAREEKPDKNLEDMFGEQSIRDKLAYAEEENEKLRMYLRIACAVIGILAVLLIVL